MGLIRTILVFNELCGTGLTKFRRRAAKVNFACPEELSGFVFRFFSSGKRNEMKFG